MIRKPRLRFTVDRLTRDVSVLVGANVAMFQRYHASASGPAKAAVNLGAGPRRRTTVLGEVCVLSGDPRSLQLLPSPFSVNALALLSRTFAQFIVCISRHTWDQIRHKQEVSAHRYTPHVFGDRHCLPHTPVPAGHSAALPEAFSSPPKTFWILIDHIHILNEHR